MAVMILRALDIAQPCGELELTLTVPQPCVGQLRADEVDAALRRLRNDLMAALVDEQMKHG